MSDKTRQPSDDRLRDADEPPTPGEQPIIEDVPPIDHAPVAPLTTPEDTEGG